MTRCMKCGSILNSSRCSVCGLDLRSASFYMIGEMERDTQAEIAQLIKKEEMSSCEIDAGQGADVIEQKTPPTTEDVPELPIQTETHKLTVDAFHESESRDAEGAPPLSYSLNLPIDKSTPKLKTRFRDQTAFAVMVLLIVAAIEATITGILYKFGWLVPMSSASTYDIIKLCAICIINTLGVVIIGSIIGDKEEVGKHICGILIEVLAVGVNFTWIALPEITLPESSPVFFIFLAVGHAAFCICVVLVTIFGRRDILKEIEEERRIILEAELDAMLKELEKGTITGNKS